MTFSEKIKIWSKQLNKLVKRNCLLNFDVLVMVSMNNNVMTQLKVDQLIGFVFFVIYFVIRSH